MTSPAEDLGLITVMLERLEKQVLPRLLVTKDKVDGGGRLDEADLAFLQEVMDRARHVGSLVDRHPEYQDLAGRLINLYKQITEKALANEQKS